METKSIFITKGDVEIVSNEPLKIPGTKLGGKEEKVIEFEDEG